VPQLAVSGKARKTYAGGRDGSGDGCMCHPWATGSSYCGKHKHGRVCVIYMIIMAWVVAMQVSK
jgi:hypothetical protein